MGRAGSAHIRVIRSRSRGVAFPAGGQSGNLVPEAVKTPQKRNHRVERMRRLVLRFGLIAPFLLAACAEAPMPYDSAPPISRAQPLPVDAVDSGPVVSPQEAARNFVSVLHRIEPVAERECRARRPDANCDFQIVVDERLDLPPNAAQTLDRNGRPIIIFTLALIAEARNTDELGFVMGHEAAHHILGHLPRQAQTATLGGVFAGGLGAALGADTSTVDALRNIGASVGGRAYSKDMELEADSLGTYIAWVSGYDPNRGAQFFARIPDPGNRFLGSHPGNSQRIAVIRATVDRLQAGGGV